MTTNQTLVEGETPPTIIDTSPLEKESTPKLSPEEQEKLDEEEEIKEFELLRDGIFNMLTMQGLSKRNNESTLRSLRRIQIRKRSEVNNETCPDLTKFQNLAPNF